MLEPSSRARRLPLSHEAALHKQGWKKRSKSVDEKLMVRKTGRVFVNSVKHTDATYDFLAAYNMTIVSSIKDAFLSCKTLAEFLRVFLSPKKIVPMSTYIDTAIQGLHSMREINRQILRPGRLD